MGKRPVPLTYTSLCWPGSRLTPIPDKATAVARGTSDPAPWFLQRSSYGRSEQMTPDCEHWGRKGATDSLVCTQPGPTGLLSSSSNSHEGRGPPARGPIHSCRMDQGHQPPKATPGGPLVDDEWSGSGQKVKGKKRNRRLGGGLPWRSSG